MRVCVRLYGCVCMCVLTFQCVKGNVFFLRVRAFAFTGVGVSLFVFLLMCVYLCL